MVQVSVCTLYLAVNVLDKFCVTISLKVNKHVAENSALSSDTRLKCDINIYGARRLLDSETLESTQTLFRGFSLNKKIQKDDILKVSHTMYDGLKKNFS